MTTPYTIAITGKGGTGKTTIAASLVSCLIREGHIPVLAVDADPNSCLDQALSVQVKKTVGQIREESRDAGANQPGGISKRELVELRIAESLVEADNFDLIGMGRPEGPGCYCYANNLFRDVISELSKNYPFIVIDNEAGLENLSRRLYRRINLLVIAGDPSKRGIETVRRLYGLAKEMEIEYDQLAVVINLVRESSVMEDPAGLVRDVGADYLVRLPFDEEIARAAESGKGVQTVQTANPVLSEVRNFVSLLNLSGDKVRGKESETG